MGGLNFWGFGRNLFRVAAGGVGRNAVSYYMGGGDIVIYSHWVIGNSYDSWSQDLMDECSFRSG